MNKLTRTFYTASAIGWDNLPRRVWQVFKSRTGISRRQLPGGELSPTLLRKQFVAAYDPARTKEYWQQRTTRFFFTPQQHAGISQALNSTIDSSTWDEQVTRVGEQLERGRVLFFSRCYADLGRPPQFNRDAIHKIDWPVGRHWSTYVQFDPRMRDLKCVWEPSRFSWAYYLARDYICNQNQKAAELFWTWFEEWDRQNPYGLTPQWACGQESTFRMFACLFAALTMIAAAATTAPRLRRLTELVWYTGRHVERNINYARGQRNNHALSEAAGLLTIGLLFPELRQAATWRAKGRAVLQTDLRRQIYTDGSYIQNTLNYHRVMLDDVLWAARLAELHDDELDDGVLERVERALNWLLQMIEPDAGRTPNYGGNDGASVLPLATCDYRDYRPTAQAVSYLLHRRRCFEPGPWDEKMLWLFGLAALDAPVRSFKRQTNFQATAGGYYTFKGPRTWALIRCHTHRDRPAQADMLHFDLWLGKHNILRDAGTYHYYSQPPWQTYFSSTAAHNTVEIDGADQMIRGPRFLWLRWCKSQLLRLELSDDERVCYFEGQHFGYTRLSGKIIHRRAICRIDDTYLVLDDLLGNGEHVIALRWRLCDETWTETDNRWETTLDGTRVSLNIQAPTAFSTAILRGQEEPIPEGWESLYYAERRPVPVICVTGRPALPVRLLTIITVAADQPRLIITDPGDPSSAVRCSGLDHAVLAEQVNLLSNGRFHHD